MDEEFNNDNFPIFLKKEDEVKIGEFETVFKKPIQLRKRMECSLLEINLPKDMIASKKTFKITLTCQFIKLSPLLKFVATPNIDFTKFENVFKTERNFDFNFEGIEENGLQKIFDELVDGANDRAITLFARTYTNFQDDRFEGMWDKVRLKYNTTDKIVVNHPGRVRLRRTEHDQRTWHTVYYYYFNFEKELHNMLGFDPANYPHLIFDNKKPERFFTSVKSAIKQPNWNINTDVYYIYCDIVKESYIGNVKANILRIFPRNKQSMSDIVNYSFDNKIFIPLRIEEIASIKISIRNNFGEVLKYDKGDIFGTLLIRHIEYI